MLEKIDRRKFLKLAVVAGAGLAVFGWGASGASAEEAEVVVSPPTSLDVEILMYHEVGSKKLTADLLQRIRGGAQPISAETFVQAFSGNIALPPQQRFFFVTLDDGRLSQYRAVLDATQTVLGSEGVFVPATFFAITKFDDPRGPIEEISGNTPSYRDGKNSYMSRDQLVELIRLDHWVDNHTVNHPDLSILGIGARSSELEIGRQRINSLWNLAEKEKPWQLFAYPYGSFNDSILSDINSLGYSLAFSTRPITNHLVSQRLYLGRLGISG